MKKIIFVIDSLEIGGAETYLLEMLKNKPSDLDIELITLYGGGILESEIPSNIKYRSLFKNSFNKKFILYRILRKITIELICKTKIFGSIFKINNLDNTIVIAFLENLACRLTSTVSTKKICWIHTDISKQEQRFNHNIRTYNKFNKIIFVSESARNDFLNFYNVNINNAIIYNCVDSININKKSNETTNLNLPVEFSVSIGRLCEAKNYPFMLTIFSKMKELGIPFKHFIVGDGPDKNKIQRMITDLKMDNDVVLLGRLTNPFPILKKAKLLLMTSDWEGFGLVIMESLILKTPVIATKIPAQQEIYGEFENYHSIEKNLEDIIQKYISIKPYLSEQDDKKLNEFSPDIFWKKIKRLSREI